jgi:hypothetical protein
MKNLVFAGVIAGVGAFAGAVPASASVFDLSFTGTGISGDVSLSFLSGTSSYTVGSVTGSVEVGTTVYTITGLTTYAGDDQLVSRSPSSTVGYVDFPGLSFETSGGFAVNLFAFNPSSYGVLLSNQNAIGDPFTGPYYKVTVADPAPTPELSTWAMLGFGFASLAVVAGRRRKTGIALLG